MRLNNVKNVTINKRMNPLTVLLHVNMEMLDLKYRAHKKVVWSIIKNKSMPIILKTFLKVNYAFQLQENIQDLSELNNFKPWKKTLIINIIDQIKVVMVPLTKWGVTWNYAYSLSKAWYINIYLSGHLALSTRSLVNVSKL